MSGAQAFGLMQVRPGTGREVARRAGVQRFTARLLFQPAVNLKIGSFVLRDMLDAKNIRPAFASHNALTVATIMEWAGNSRDFEFQRLHGMGDGLYERWADGRLLGESDRWFWILLLALFIGVFVWIKVTAPDAGCESLKRVRRLLPAPTLG